MSESPVVLPVDAPWPAQRIDELCSIVSRGAAPAYVERSDVLAIGQRCVTATGFDASVARPHSADTRNALLAVPGDVLLNSTGTGTIGRSCVFEELGKYAADTHVTVLRPQGEKLDSYWLDSMLRSPWGQRHLERFCYSGSTNQVELHRAQLASTRLPVPPLDDQAAFRSVLVALDTTIRQTEAIIEKLKQVKQGLLHDLLTRGIDANGELRPPHSEAPHLYSESLQGWIPLGAAVLGLEDVPPPTRPVLKTGPFGSSLKGEHFTESGIPVVTIGSLGVNVFLEEALLYVAESTATELADFALIPGDIAFSRVADVGRSVVVEEAQRGWIMSSNFMRISVDTEKVLPSFLQALLSFDARVKRQVRSTINSAGRDVASSAILMALRFVVPPITEQAEIMLRIGAIEDRIRAETAALFKLQRTKSGLMDDLLTGRVRVTPLLTPASR